MALQFILEFISLIIFIIHTHRTNKQTTANECISSQIDTSSYINTPLLLVGSLEEHLRIIDFGPFIEVITMVTVVP